MSTLCQAFAETIAKVGPGLIEGREYEGILKVSNETDCFLSTGLEEICLLCIQILEQKALCQQDPDQEDEPAGDDENQAEFDSVLISTASDLVASLASVLGAEFRPAFKSFLPLIGKYYVSFS